MLIGIDASRAVSDAPTGTETYSRELIRALLQVDSENQYRLYTRQDSTAHSQFSPPDLKSTIPIYEIRSIPFPRLWSHARLSFEMLTHAPDLLWIPAHVLPLVHPSRSIVTIHDLGNLYFPEVYPTGQRWYHRWSQEWNAREATHIFADSLATKHDLETLFHVAPEKISVVYPAFDDRLFKPESDLSNIQRLRSRFRIEGDYILTVGTVHPRKNYARLAEAFRKLSFGSCQLVIVGKKGWMYREILSKLAAFGDRVKFLDYLPREDLPALISGARLFVFPSLYEGFGLPILEAQACGVPVICSNSSSLPEAAGKGALFFDPHDLDAIADAIERGLTDTSLRTNLIEQGIENLKRFGWAKSAQVALDVFRRIGVNA